MKKPVIATNTGGIPEMMIDSQTGFLVEEGDHNGWIKHLSNTINDENLSKKLGEEGRKFVNETFNWEKIAKNFLKILNKYQ
jgi:glycosyltransferase involved in cell wall biosynthesis